MNWDLLMFLLVAHNGVIHNVDRPLTTMESTIITNWVRQIKERSPKHGLESLTLSWKQDHNITAHTVYHPLHLKLYGRWSLDGTQTLLSSKSATLLLLRGSINYSIRMVRIYQCKYDWYYIIISTIMYQCKNEILTKVAKGNQGWKKNLSDKLIKT